MKRKNKRLVECHSLSINLASFISVLPISEAF
jgi:hypothetical protein